MDKDKIQDYIDRDFEWREFLDWLKTSRENVKLSDLDSLVWEFAEEQVNNNLNDDYYVIGND